MNHEIRGAGTDCYKFLGNKKKKKKQSPSQPHESATKNVTRNVPAKFIGEIKCYNAQFLLNIKQL
ncbi:MAG: hypothetical protein O7D30_01600, partial [Rickettsia endosymbiont of Ixodes persulcatus]|nr:hypothetical protein [Rickettsia endosymbiont of Ixodes persulcatus]